MSHRATGSEGAPGPDLARTEGTSTRQEKEPSVRTTTKKGICDILSQVACQGKDPFSTMALSPEPSRLGQRVAISTAGERAEGVRAATLAAGASRQGRPALPSARARQPRDRPVGWRDLHPARHPALPLYVRSQRGAAVFADRGARSLRSPTCCCSRARKRQASRSTTCRKSPTTSPP
jgi:hypothetical protein